MKSSLVVVQGKPEGLEIPIKGVQFLIGRDKQCHLRPNSDLVSKLHCEMIATDNGLRLRDLDSTNGTFVNGRRISGEVTLEDGDLVKVGGLVFAVRVICEQTARRHVGCSPDDSSFGWLLADSTAGKAPGAEPSSNSTQYAIPVPDFKTRQIAETKAATS